MPFNPRSLDNLVTVHLESGVTSEVHRVRAPAEVQAWFRALGAERRGELLTGLLDAQGGGDPAAPTVPVQPPTVAPAPAEGAGSAGEFAGVASRPSGERLRLSGAVRGRLSDPQARLVEHLEAGAELIRDGAAGQWAVYLPGGEVEAVAAQTVKALLRGGVLRH